MTALNSLIAAIDAAPSAVGLIAAVRQLAAARDPAAIPKLIEILGYNNPGAAVAAVEGLVALGPMAVEPLLTNLDGYDYGARAWANRALAQIGDPRALENLLAAAQGDFALSVRRAAAKGLGFLDWSTLPPNEQEAGQKQAFAALMVALGDEEWVVRYGAIAGLQGLAQNQPQWQSSVRQILRDHLPLETELALQARLHWAIQSLTKP
ncbi:HEAT repeat domain-containing protein [Spirulina sp. CCNP1310]|uniref:HEAT repeat domain-containing protein n=1 Tax=Spirulina sp. CCNP1310 TaxID=3110249 RepID=UPI002B21D059|nr:HEAT repeat domain-containing protein [Spirulina sp. CCNP1310]MEA5418730.1 HEAT repeat domain-containing protein [Spirulina sp. CCNP1310]